jgi:hypothetical protein
LNTSASHELVPQRGTAHRVRDGLPADLRNPRDYPAEALCLKCSQPVRISRWLLMVAEKSQMDTTPQSTDSEWREGHEGVRDEGRA